MLGTILRGTYLRLLDKELANVVGIYRLFIVQYLWRFGSFCVDRLCYTYNMQFFIWIKQNRFFLYKFNDFATKFHVIRNFSLILKDIHLIRKHPTALSKYSGLLFPVEYDLISTNYRIVIIKHCRSQRFTTNRPLLRTIFSDKRQFEQ